MATLMEATNQVLTGVGLLFAYVLNNGRVLCVHGRLLLSGASEHRRPVSATTRQVSGAATWEGQRAGRAGPFARGLSHLQESSCETQPLSLQTLPMGERRGTPFSDVKTAAQRGGPGRPGPAGGSEGRGPWSLASGRAPPRSSAASLTQTRVCNPFGLCWRPTSQPEPLNHEKHGTGPGWPEERFAFPRAQTPGHHRGPATGAGH